MPKPFEINVSSKYGAPMGRHSHTFGSFDKGRKLHLQRVPLIDGAYDKGGAYWGAPDDLWCAWDDAVTFYLRAGSRALAKDKLPGARFYR